MAETSELSPTQMRIASVLSDGKWHRRQELLNVMDSQADNLDLNSMIHVMRRRISARNEVIICETHPGHGLVYRRIG